MPVLLIYAEFRDAATRPSVNRWPFVTFVSKHGIKHVNVANHLEGEFGVERVPVPTRLKQVFKSREFFFFFSSDFTRKANINVWLLFELILWITSV